MHSPHVFFLKSNIALDVKQDVSISLISIEFHDKAFAGGFKQLLGDNLEDLRREYHVASLWLFGFYVRGKQHKRCDIDILVEFEDVPTLPKFISLERKLCEVTGIKVDLVSVRALKGEIGERILKERVAL